MGGSSDDAVGLAASQAPPRSACPCARFPSVIRFIIITELCERFCYYGLRAILTRYLKNELHYSKADAVSIASFASALAYFTPILGGYISDTYLGKFRTILWFSITYVLGTGTLSLSAIDPARWGMFLGLFLIGVGTGGIKPCVSTFGADQIAPEDRDLQTSYFQWFYFSINTGSVMSQFLTPVVKAHYGYAMAFSLPFFLLTVAVFVFASGKNQYKVYPPRGSIITTVYRIMKTARAAPQPSGGHWLDSAVPTYSRQQVQEVKDFLRTLPIFAVLPVFWSLFDQQGSSWQIQSEEMSGQMGSIHVQTEQLQVLNPVFILALIPVFDNFIYPWFARNYPITPLGRMTVGMLFGSVAFVAAGFLQIEVDSQPPNSVSVFWQMPQYLLLSIGEVLVSITGLEFAYAEAPESMKGMVMSAFLLTTAVGDLLIGVLFSSLKMRLEYLFFLFAALMFINTVLFQFVRTGYKYRQPESVQMSVLARDDPVNDRQQLLANTGDHDAVDALETIDDNDDDLAGSGMDAVELS